MASEPGPLATSSASFDASRTSPNEDHARLVAERPHDGEAGTVEKLSKRDRLRELKQKTKTKTKRILKIGGPHVHGEHHNGRYGDAFRDLELDPAFNPKRLENEEESNFSDGKASKPLGPVQKVVKTIAHPKDAVKSMTTKTTAGILSTAEHPDVSQKSDYDFLQEHCAIAQGQNPADVPDLRTDEYLETTRKLESHRESKRVAWITGRHVFRVRVVPKRYLTWPDPSAFKEYSEDGTVIRYRWEKWLAYVMLYYTQDFSAQYIDDFDELPFDLIRLRSHVERLIMASAPWQAWLMHIRRVFRWEDPAETGRWLGVYLVIWYTQNMGAFVWGYILYMVIRNRYYPSSLESLRESMERSQERGSMAYRLGELIDKHGREDWLEPLIDELGPFLQLQLGDLASILEVFSNFYAWKTPRKTASSLFFFACCLLLALFADITFCMKVFWFVSGAGFFVSWPISSRYPKYRYLVSPIKWVTWDIPTHTEWSFQYLRSKAQLRREEMIEQKVEFKASHPILDSYHGHISRGRLPGSVTAETSSSSSDDSEDDETDDFHSVSSGHSILDESDFYSVRCAHDGVVGRLVIYSHGLRFLRRSSPLLSANQSSTEVWRRSFMELKEMRKPDPSSPSKSILLKNIKIPPIPPLLASSTSSSSSVATTQKLEILFTEDHLVVLTALRNRDEVFNLIVGFSGLHWQSLQAPATAPRSES